jgi:S-formylglutathione hydrolase FrmB
VRLPALAAVLAALGLSAHAASAKPLHLASVQHLDPRLEQLVFHTPAVRGLTGVRVLVPRGYSAHRRRRYPVVYLLHGAIDNFTSWTQKGDAEAITARYPVIVVMPDSGPSGGYTNWFNGGAGGPPEWETYHIDQLLPWIDAHFRTRASRSERAIAGLSMGGFGAMSYAARHPDLFAAAASFSGAVDTNNAGDIAVTPDAVWGPRATQEVRWRGHNPTDLAANLGGVNLTIRTGNGLPGGPFGGGDVVEQVVHQMNITFHDRLQQLGVPSLYDDYGPGGHDWPYWERDLRQTLPTFMSVFNHRKPSPSAFTFTAVEPRYSVYGWSVAVRRPALEFSTLRVRAPGSFTLSGSGTGIVRTPSRYPADQRLTVRVTDARGTRTELERVGRSGRLVVALDLGPTNRHQQYTALANAIPRHSLAAMVTIGTPR